MKEMNKVFIFILLLFAGLTSCSGKVSQEELLAYLNDENNGVKVSKEVGDVQVALAYKPSDLLIEQELKNKPDITDAEIEKIKANYQKGLYFTLSMSKGGQELEVSALGDQSQFAKRIERLSFGMRELVSLQTSDNQKVSLLDHVYSRMYGMTGKSTMLLIFDRAEATQAAGFTVTLNGYDLGIGVNTFRFTTKDIHNVPQLALDHDGKK